MIDIGRDIFTFWLSEYCKLSPLHLETTGLSTSNFKIDINNNFEAICNKFVK